MQSIWMSQAPAIIVLVTAIAAALAYVVYQWYASR